MSELVTSGEGQSLIELDEAKRHIALAREMAAAEELHEWRDRAAAMLHYSKMRGDSQEAANQAAEIKVRAEAALGALDSEMRPASVGRNGAQMASPSESITPDLGVAAATRANWRKLGQLDEEKLDEVIATVRELDDTISTAAVVKVARKATELDDLRKAAADRSTQKTAAEAALTDNEREMASQTMSRLVKYEPTSEFITTHSLLAAQAAEASNVLPQIAADEKGVVALARAASQYQQVADAINEFIGGTNAE